MWGELDSADLRLLSFRDNDSATRKVGGMPGHLPRSLIARAYRAFSWALRALPYRAFWGAFVGWHLLILLTHFYTPEGSQPYPRSDSLYEELNHRWVGVPVHCYGWYASIVVAAIGAALGAISVRGGTNPRLPFYPWAVRERNHGSVAQDVDIAGGKNVRVLVAVFDTPRPARDGYGLL